MKILKGLALSLLSFLLFLSLTIFGVVFTLSSTVLNSNFLASELDKIDVSALVQEIETMVDMPTEEDFPEELMTAIVDTVDKLEAPVKAEISAAIGDIYDYLLGKKDQPDLAATLGNTFLNSAFVTSLMDALDLSLLVEELLSEQMDEGEFPEELMTAIIDTIDKLEAPVKAEISAAVDPLFDYLLGETQSIDLAQTLGDTFLNSDFVASVMEALDLPLLVEEVMGEQMGEEEFPEEFSTGLVNIITDLEPMIKEKITAAAGPLLDYLLGKTQSIDLAQTLRDTVLTSDFVTSLMDKLAISSLASEFLGGELSGQIPEEMEFLAEHLDDVIADLEPTIKEQISAAAGPLLDYLLGLKESVSIVISLEPVVESLEDALREVLMEQLPSEYASLPRSQLDQLFAEYFAELTRGMPLSIDIGETLVEILPVSQITDALAEAEDGLADARQSVAEGIAEAEDGLGEARQDIAEGIADAEDGLGEAKKYVGYYQLGYWGLLGFMALLILGIVLIHREVKGATRGIGITALTYGAIQFAGILIGKNILNPLITEKLAEQMKDIPAVFQNLSTQLLDGFTSPMQTLSLGLLIGGVVLIVISFVYPKWRQPAAEAEDSED